LADAGVLLVPMQGTRNLEGIPSAALQAQFGFRFGILTDATDVATLDERPNKRRSSEEKKIVKVVDMFSVLGLDPPKVFGVTERDLLYALPEDGVRAYLGEYGTDRAADFPGWDRLDAEARAAYDVRPDVSVHWKQHAQEQYGLPLASEDGVRRLVRWIDVNGYPMPSIAAVTDQIVRWALAASADDATAD
jgi:hypothetical protein